jgi:hypothetical protein
MATKIEFETFREIGSYEISNLTRKEPSSINSLSYKKYKVTIQLIEEDNEVYISRLRELMAKQIGYTRQQRINEEINKLLINK